MADYVTSGQPFYGFDEALQDSYLSLLMQQALDKPLTPIRSQPMPWNG